MEDRRIQELKSVLDNAEPKRKKSSIRAPHIEICGDCNVVGDGNTVITTPVIRVRRTIVPPQDAISSEQKLKIKEAINEWVSVHNTVRTRAKPLTHAAAWSRFYKRFRIASYAELPAIRFEEALTWLKQRRASIDNMKSAPQKDPKWRTRAISAIHARCKSHFGGERIYRSYIEKNFGASSLTQLTNDQIAQVRRWLFQKNT